jgi:hypothetical protein
MAASFESPFSRKGRFVTQPSCSTNSFSQGLSAPADGGGFFKGASRFSIDNPTMIENQINLSPVPGMHAIAFVLDVPS